MNRRGFFGWAVGIVVGLVGVKKSEGGQKQLYKRCFRINGHGSYRSCEEIQWEDQKPGDEVFWFGFDGKKLYFDFVTISGVKDVQGECIVHAGYLRDMIKDAVDVFHMRSME